MNPRTLLIGLTVLAALLGCVSPQSTNMPEPTTTEFFRTVGGGFINGKATLRYALNFQIRKPINDSPTWYAEVRFDNPEDESRPLIQLLEFPAGQNDISIRSMELHAIRNHTTYRVLFKAFSDAERTSLVATHEMFVRFDVPDQMMPVFGVKVL